MLGALDTNPPLDTSPPLHPLGLAGKQKGDKTKTYSAPEGCQRYHVWKEPDFNPPLITCWLWNFRQRTQIVLTEVSSSEKQVQKSLSHKVSTK